MRSFILLLLFFLCFYSGLAQFNWGFTAGVGSHEALHAGMKVLINPKHSFTFAYGNFLGIIPKEKYWNVSLEYDRVFRSRRDIFKLSNWSFCPKLFYWRLNDSFYYFKVFSLQPAVSYNFKLSNKQGFKFEFGPVFMIVENYKRLTFYEAGWPKKFMFNGSVHYYFMIR